ncbi:MAG: hypothetical protein WCB53_15630 [Terriglobales bacterium]
MSRYCSHLAILISVLALAVAAAARTPGKQASKPADPEVQNPLIFRFQQFSAHVTGGIAHDHDRQIYRSGKWMRVDFDDSYRVNDLDTLHMWSVGATRCVEFSRPYAGTYPFSAYQDFNAERTTLPEEETIDGHVCKIEVVTLTPKDDRPITAKMKLWEANDLEGFPIKIQVEDSGQTFTSTYTNVSLTAPDPKLFQHPTKCTPGLQPGQQGVIKLDK